MKLAAALVASLLLRAQSPEPPSSDAASGSPAPIVRILRQTTSPKPVHTDGSSSSDVQQPNPAQPAGGAQQATDTTVFRIESRLVPLAINVVDARGSPVGGLEQKDFEVFENGRPQKIAFFDRESTTPLSVVLAIDSSESVLTNERLEREAAKKFVKSLLREKDELDLMDFSDEVREIVPFTSDHRSIETGLGELKRGDSTALYDAVYLASDRLATTSVADGRRRVLVLITDGDDTAKKTEYTQAMQHAQHAGAMIFSIIIVPIAADAGRNTAGEHALIQMSDDTGGKYYYVEDKRDLAPAFEKVSEDLRTQYVVGYYAPQRGQDDSFRAIKVRLKDAPGREGYKLRYRAGYYADGR